MGMEEKHLCPTTTIIRGASKEKLTVLGIVPVLVQAVGHWTPNQADNTGSLYHKGTLNTVHIKILPAPAGVPTTNLALPPV